MNPQLILSASAEHQYAMVQHKRHLAKTISYRLISTLIGFLIVWISTGSIKMSAAFSLAELLVKPFVYYLHERVWYKYIKFGLRR